MQQSKSLNVLLWKNDSLNCQTWATKRHLDESLSILTITFGSFKSLWFQKHPRKSQLLKLHKEVSCGMDFLTREVSHQTFSCMHTPRIHHVQSKCRTKGNPCFTLKPANQLQLMQACFDSEFAKRDHLCHWQACISCWLNSKTIIFDNLQMLNHMLFIDPATHAPMNLRSFLRVFHSSHSVSLNLATKATREMLITCQRISCSTKTEQPKTHGDKGTWVKTMRLPKLSKLNKNSLVFRRKMIKLHRCWMVLNPQSHVSWSHTAGACHALASTVVTNWCLYDVVATVCTHGTRIPVTAVHGAK